MSEHPTVRTVLAPYDCGHRGLRMGAGPDHLMGNGLSGIPPAEVATAFELEGASALEAALDGLEGRVGRVYVHLDLDVLDPEKTGKANEFAPESGLGAEDLKTAPGLIRERFAIAAGGIASYDPAFDGLLDTRSAPLRNENPAALADGSVNQ